MKINRNVVLDRLEKGEMVYLKNDYYSSEAVKVIDGYMKYGDHIYQVVRDEYNMEYSTIDIKYFMVAPQKDGDSLLVEMRGINMFNENEKMYDPDLFREMQENIIIYYNPDKHYIPSEIVKLGTKWINNFPNDLKTEIKSKTFLYRGTYLGMKATVFDDVELFINKVIEDYNYAKKELKDNKKLSEVVHSIKNNPIYEVYSYKDDDKTVPSEVIGFVYNPLINKLVQFTKVEVSNYKSTHYYFYYSSDGNINTIVEIKDVILGEKESSVTLMDKNYIDDKDLKSDNDGDYIRSLFKGLSENFIIDNWSNVSVIRDKNEIDKFEVESRDIDEFSSFLINNGSIREE